MRLGPFKNFRIHSHFSHNYRLPTFNDLYWETLGNPDLIPEYSWNSELGGSYRNFWGHSARFKTELSATGFCNLVNNWILWSPNASGLWRPDNVDQVLARGLEATAVFKADWNKWEAQLRLQYAYTQSTRTQGNAIQTIGKQLIYVPSHQANAALLVAFRKSSVLLQSQWTGRRYTDDLNNAFLPDFVLLHLRFEQRFEFKKGAVVYKAIIYWGRSIKWC